MGAVICKCGGKSGVIESRPHKNSIRRRRKCKSCGLRWSTLEVKGLFEVDKPAIMREAKRVKAQTRLQAAAQQEACGASTVQGAQKAQE